MQTLIFITRKPDHWVCFADPLLFGLQRLYDDSRERTCQLQRCTQVFQRVWILVDT